MKKEVINFSIERLDPLGQGVSKIDDKISFIPKTLPGESGTAQIVGKKKGVQFAQLIELKNPSKDRIKPECPHWTDCSGCSYLHTSYEMELENKLKSFERSLSFTRFKGESIHLHSDKRFEYRNRVQLHYDREQNIIGFFKGKSNKIHSITNCLLCHPSIQSELQNFDWQSEVPSNAPTRGHVELYLKDQKVLKTWNASYSSGGFSQVNQVMNQKALELWNKFYLECKKPKSVYDVFGGSGNISRSFIDSEVLVIDSYCDETKLSPHQKFLRQDLYKQSTPPSSQTDFLLFDPPRSGFKECIDWISSLEPKFVGHQSCFPETMIRDLRELPEHWAVHEIHLLDFFPGTHHYEALMFFKNTRV